MKKRRRYDIILNKHFKTLFQAHKEQTCLHRKGQMFVIYLNEKIKRTYSDI